MCEGGDKLQHITFPGLAGPPPGVVDISRFDIIRREDVHMSTVWPFLIKTVKLSPKTAVDTTRLGVHTALGPQRGFNFGLSADP